MFICKAHKYNVYGKIKRPTSSVARVSTTLKAVFLYRAMICFKVSRETIDGGMTLLKICRESMKKYLLQTSLDVLRCKYKVLFLFSQFVFIM